MDLFYARSATADQKSGNGNFRVSIKRGGDSKFALQRRSFGP